jgi:hypothetical protein
MNDSGWNELRRMWPMFAVVAFMVGIVVLGPKPKPYVCTPGECIKSNNGFGHHECVEWCPYPNPIKVQNDRDKMIINEVITQLKEAGCTCPPKP